MAELAVALWSRARRRQRAVHANVGSMTHLRDCTAKLRWLGFEPTSLTVIDVASATRDPA